MSDADDGIDKEALREELREKYERDEADREATRRMSDLLLKGATMTNTHCGTCGDPLFAQNGTTFCPSCHGSPEAVEADAAGAGDADGSEPSEEPADEANQEPPDGANRKPPDEANRQARDEGRREAPGGTNREAPGAGDRSGGGADATTDDDRPADPDRGRDDGRADVAGSAAVERGAAVDDRRRSPSRDSTDRRGTAGGGPRGRETRAPANRPRPADSERGRSALPAGADSAGSPRQPSIPAGEGNVADARRALVASLDRFAREAASTDDPRRARACLEAAREAAETIATLDR